MSNRRLRASAARNLTAAGSHGHQTCFRHIWFPLTTVEGVCSARRGRHEHCGSSPNWSQFGGGGWVGDTPLVVRTGTTLRLPSCPPRIACLYMFSVVCVSCPGSVKSRKSFQLGVCMSVRLFVQPSKSQRQDNVESKETGIAASFPPQIPCTYTHTHTYFILAFFFLPFKQDNAAAATAPRRIVSNVEKGSSKDRRQPSACAAVVLFCERTISSIQSRRTVHATDRRALSYICKLSFCVFCSLL